MKRMLPATFSLLLLLAGPVHAAMDQARLVSTGASVYRIEVLREVGGYGLGSGVAVGQDAVVTNCHVTRTAKRVFVVRGEDRLVVVGQASDFAHDLCLLKVPGLQSSHAQLGDSRSLEVGQPLTALGYTGGAGLARSQGQVVQLHRLDGARVIQSSTAFNSGASGGGLFADSGALVGILTFRLRGASSHYFAAPAEWVQGLIDVSQRGGFRAFGPPGEGGSPAYWELSDGQRPHFLEATVLLQEGRWDELQVSARHWLRAEPENPDTWAALGIALIRLDRTLEGRSALHCALRLDHNHHGARLWLSQTRDEIAGLADAPSDCGVT
jgi:serine protease Do